MLRSRGPSLPEHRGHLHAPDRYGSGSPTNRTRSRAFNFLTWARPSFLRRIPTPVKVVIALLLFVVAYFAYTREIHVEIQFYKRDWVKQEVLRTEPLAGCFEPESIAANGNVYNISNALHGPKRTELHAGLSMRLGMDCYDFAGTIPYPLPPHNDADHQLPRNQRTNYHTYWRADLEPFGERQEWMLKSFFATQDLSSSTLILWTNDAAAMLANIRIALYIRAYPAAFEVRGTDVKEMAKGTALDGSPRLLGTNDAKAWVDGDLVRLLVIWRLGGVWVDMDSLLTRDLSPLLEHEFVTQWDCYGTFISSSTIMRYLSFLFTPFLHRQDISAHEWRSNALP